MTADLITVQLKIAPELTEVVERRYRVMRNIYFLQPIGRRALAAKLGEPERSVRREMDFLREAGLVVAEANGMKLSKEGEDLLLDLEEYVRQLRGLGHLEDLLASRLGLDKAIVVPGDSDDDPSVKRELARAAARFLKDVLKDGDIIAVTGGTTMAELAEAIVPTSGRRCVTVVPARGSLGEDVEKQADTVAAQIAKKLGGTYRLLNVPDDLREEARATIVDEPRVKEVLETIAKATVVVHGIGTAMEMARRRRLPQSEVEIIGRRGAVGEAFGFYFDREGEVVYSTSSIGIRLNDLANVKTVVAVGGGRSKAEAVIAVLANRYTDILVTDEGATRKILELATPQWGTF